MAEVEGLGFTVAPAAPRVTMSQKIGKTTVTVEAENAEKACALIVKAISAVRDAYRDGALKSGLPTPPIDGRNP